MKKLKNLFRKKNAVSGSPSGNIPALIVRIIRPIKNQLILLKIEIINYINHK